MEKEKIFAEFPSTTDSKRSLPELCTELLESQRRSWPSLQEGLRGLEHSTTREIFCRGFTVRVQYNPRRIVSTAAKVDADSIGKRPCFLCTENRPQEQEAVLCRGSYLMLANPVPIFHGHFTLACREHAEQEFEKYLDDFLALAADLGPTFSIFYNGPRCGASAPDHMHFQVSPSRSIPVERDIDDPWRVTPLKKVDGVTVSDVKDYGRGVIVISSASAERCANIVRRLIGVIKELCDEPEEPMMNVICRYETKKWTLIFFPRKKHRPSVYFADDRVVISPAAVDMGGLIITPVEKDFRSITSGLIESIYHEVGVSADRVQKYIENV